MTSPYPAAQRDVWLQARRILGCRRVPTADDIVSDADPRLVRQWVDDEIRRWDATSRALGVGFIARHRRSP